MHEPVDVSWANQKSFCFKVLKELNTSRRHTRHASRITHASSSTTILNHKLDRCVPWPWPVEECPGRKCKVPHPPSFQWLRSPLFLPQHITVEHQNSTDSSHGRPQCFYSSSLYCGHFCQTSGLSGLESSGIRTGTRRTMRKRYHSADEQYDREWTLLIPSYTVILVLLTYFTYLALAIRATPSFSELSAVTGQSFILMRECRPLTGS